MFAIKRINNNAVLCVDANGHQVVALGSELAGVVVPGELDVTLAERTFYDVEPRYIDVMRDLPTENIELAASVMDSARALLPYELSRNTEIALADHITFALQRMKEHVYLAAPLAYDLQQNYPLECKIAQYAMRLVRERLGVELPRSEMSGIALCIINGAYGNVGSAIQDDAKKKEEALEHITGIVEESMGVVVDREGFGFARFATHVQYLLQRVEDDDDILSGNADAYAALATDHPQVSECVDSISHYVETMYQHELTKEEKLYLILHVNRICARSEG